MSAGEGRRLRAKLRALDAAHAQGGRVSGLWDGEYLALRARRVTA